MNRSVRSRVDHAIAGTARAIIARATCRIRSWFRGAGLQQASITSTNLEHALLRAAGEFSLHNNVPLDILVVGRPKALNAYIRENLYHIAREALGNAFQHAQATKIEAEIEYSPRRVRVIVRDNGCGMDPETVKSRCHAHLGLRLMRERAQSAGANLRIWSRPKGGTEVEIFACGAMLDELSV